MSIESADKKSFNYREYWNSRGHFADMSHGECDKEIQMLHDLNDSGYKFLAGEFEDRDIRLRELYGRQRELEEKDPLLIDNSAFEDNK
jgi:hypothetical protein